jgi:hypothetical protein
MDPTRGAPEGFPVSFRKSAPYISVRHDGFPIWASNEVLEMVDGIGIPQVRSSKWCRRFPNGFPEYGFKIW